RNKKKTRDSSHRPDGATQPRSDTDRDADNIRAAHELAEAHDVGKVLLAYPPLLIDGEAPRPDKPTSTADPVQRDLQEGYRDRSKRSVLGVAMLDIGL